MFDFHVDREKCIGCGQCAADCPMAIIAMEENLPVIPAANEGLCIHCLHFCHLRNRGHRHPR